MKVKEILGENVEQPLDPEQFYIYYDYTGAGRGPEPIAGPFYNQSDAEEYAEDSNMDLTDKNIFIDLGHEEQQDES